MTDAELDRIAEAATRLRINFTTGRYHKPVALIWAIIVLTGLAASRDGFRRSAASRSGALRSEWSCE